MLQALGVTVNRSVQSRLADGSVETIEVGETKIRLGGRQFTTPVIFAEEGEHSLLVVNPVNNRLIPVLAKR